MNKNQALEKKQIKQHVNARIERGEPKQQILEELSHLYKDSVTIVRLLEQTPSKLLKSKCRLYNYLLSVLLLAALALDSVAFSAFDWEKGYWIIAINSGLNVVLDAVFLVGVLLYRIETYSWIATRAIFTVTLILISYYYHNSFQVGGMGGWVVFVSLTLIIISFVLGLFLGVKLCPQRVPKIIEIDIDGVEKIKKTIYVFPD
jgi:hypothetical protein